MGLKSLELGSINSMTFEKGAHRRWSQSDLGMAGKHSHAWWGTTVVVAMTLPTVVATPWIRLFSLLLLFVACKNKNTLGGIWEGLWLWRCQWDTQHSNIVWRHCQLPTQLEYLLKISQHLTVNISSWCQWNAVIPIQRDEGGILRI